MSVDESRPADAGGPGEDWARTALQRAAATVDVAPVPAPRPERAGWLRPAVAAAAAVAAVAAGAALAPTLLERGATPPADEGPAAEDWSFHLGPDQVPSVFGYSAEDARTMLVERGLAVTVRDVPWCGDAGRAVGTRPATGRVVAPGAEVTLLRSLGEHPTAACRAYTFDDAGRRDAWALIEWIDGRAAAPAFADDVAYYLGDQGRTPLTGAPADVASWPGLRRAVDAMVAAGSRRGPADTYSRLFLFTSRDERACLSTPPALADRPALTLDFEVPMDGVSPGSCRNLHVYRDATGAIEALWLDVSRQPGEVEYFSPDVTGNSLAYAEERLTAAGFAVEVVRRRDCGQVGLVSAQTPYSTQPVGDDRIVTLAVVSAPGPCVAAPPEEQTPAAAAARSLVRFARGGEPPAFADRVRLYVGDEEMATFTAEAAAQLDTWSDALDVLDEGTVVHTTGAPGSSCLRRGNQDRLPATTPIRISQPEAPSCAEEWSVLVWADDAGAVEAVDVLHGDPSPR